MEGGVDRMELKCTREKLKSALGIQTLVMGRLWIKNHFLFLLLPKKTNYNWYSKVVEK
jgi:hypothetical protein